MAYQIYLIEESGDFVELDTEDVDFSTVFSVADLSDISIRKDNITKTIVFKGTQTNNRAFGHLSSLNMVSDFDLSNSLFFNYNPLRAVDCMIYEDGILLFRGALRVTDIPIDKNNNISYSTYVTGSFSDFRNLIGDKLLTDLDLSDLRHRFTWDNLEKSWDVRTERYNTSSDTFEFKPFAKGSGYVYPFIDYGYTFRNTEAKQSLSSVHIGNYQPAVYLKEYWDRMIGQLPGFTYELKGTELNERFNSLIIPNSSEAQTSQTNDLAGRAYTSANQTHDPRRFDIDVDGGGDMYIYLNLEQLQAGAGIFHPFGNYLPSNILPQCVYLIDREFTANGLMTVGIQNFYNRYPSPVKLSLELCERSFIAADDAQFDVRSTWSVVSKSAQITVPGDAGISNQTLNLEIGERKFEETSQICLRVHVEGGNFILENNNLFKRFSYTINSGQMRFPKDADSSIKYNLTVGDEMTPIAPTGIKQMDFIKSVIQLFNLYVYTEKQRPKHLIFQTYDDFYALNRQDLLPSVSLDWSGKVDFNSPRKNKSNLSLPKKYLFSFKEDNDFLNSSYKNANGEVYGSFRFNDDYGLGNEKKVELIFSPAPLVQYKGTGRVHPAIYQMSGADKKPSKSNIRLMYYNGVKSCRFYTVGRDVVASNGGFEVGVISLLNQRYPQVGNYWLQSGLNNNTPVDDLYFGLPRQLYFDQLPAHEQCSTAYHSYYSGQISDLTNPNVRYFECYILLNENDINELDFRTPIFIDTPQGHAYFRLLNVEYEGKNLPARVEMMKIS